MQRVDVARRALALIPGPLDPFQIATAAQEGRLSHASAAKVATSPSGPCYLICMYVHDFTDVDGCVDPLLGQLRDLGFSARLSFKADAVTYMFETGDPALGKVKPSFFGAAADARNCYRMK